MATRQFKRQKDNTLPRCTVNELDTILTFSTGGLMMMPSNDMDEVFQGIYIGDESSVRCINKWQKSKGITHVLNTAKGNKDGYHVNLDPKMYQKAGIVYMAIEATDARHFTIDIFFEKTTKFIDDALKSGGKVLVNCREGFSRSSTIVLAYLMARENMTVQEATRHVRKYREIGPNDGFLQQLCDFNEKLWNSGHFKNKTDPLEEPLEEKTEKIS